MADDTCRTKLDGVMRMLPHINRDLKICDLVKKENALLHIKIGALESSLKIANRKEAGQNAQLRKEKRKRVTGHVVRTVIEVSVIILIVLI